MTMQEAVIKNIDTDYSYQLAKRMEQFRSNEKLGYRPAGSKAEFLTGEMLKDEMQKLGLSDVCKNAVTVDGWEFENAELTFETKEGKRHTALLGAYQTDFVTDGEQAFSLMYLGKGTEADYEGKDVTGKLVLVDINQRDEWWINYPVYQAHLKGAAVMEKSMRRHSTHRISPDRRMHRHFPSQGRMLHYCGNCWMERKKQPYG